MRVKQVWMSGDTARKSRYALRTLGGILGVAALLMALTAGLTVLALVLRWPMQAVGLLFCAGITALGFWLGLRLGQRSLRDATVFLLTDDDRLFLLNAGELNNGRTLLRYAAGTLRTQALLRELATDPFVPALAKEILQVENIRETAGHYALRCRMRVQDGPVFRKTCLLVKGVEAEDQLLRQLERRRNWQTDWEPQENRNPLYITLSGAALAVLVLLCVMSHPAVGTLSADLYFPCLGGAFVAFFLLVYCILRQTRGE